MAEATLIIADDHEIFLDGLRKLLDPDFTLLATVTDGDAALAEYDRQRPDLLLLDVSLPPQNGIETARELKRRDPRARILFVTMQSDITYVQEAFRVGANGYVIKQAAATELCEAIRAVLNGSYYLSCLIGRRAKVRGGVSETNPLNQFGGDLTARQLEVLQLVAQGKSLKEIAHVLDIAVRTVEFHKSGIMQQLGLNSTAELTRFALEHGIAGERSNSA